MLLILQFRIRFPLARETLEEKLNEQPRRSTRFRKIGELKAHYEPRMCRDGLKWCVFSILIMGFPWKYMSIYGVGSIDIIDGCMQGTFPTTGQLRSRSRNGKKFG